MINFSATSTRSLTPEESRLVREVARALVKELTDRGHICLHAEDWGTMKADMAAIKHEVMGGDGRPSLREEMAAVHTERRVAGWVINVVVGLASAIIGAKFGR